MKKIKNIKDDNYELEVLSEFRIREKYSLFPVIIVGDRFIWTGKWFKTVKIGEQKIRERFIEFDDGWTYTYHWCEWLEGWEFINIIN